MFTFQSLIDYDNTILDGAELVPAGIDPEIVKSEIMLQCGLLQPLYPEPETMKNAITQWFAARHWTFEHLLNIIKAEYSPIENTDRYDEQTRDIARALDRSEDESKTGNENRSRSENRNRSENRDHDQNTTSDVHTTGETVGEVSAFNSDSWTNSDRNTSTGDTHGEENINGNETMRGSDTISGTDRGETSETRKNSADEDENTKEVFKQHLHGNIGVTTNQDMIEQELALLAHFNIYSWIAMNIRESLFLEVY
jgi:hypothetical protein